MDLIYGYQEGVQRVAREENVNMAEGTLNRVTDL